VSCTRRTISIFCNKLPKTIVPKVICMKLNCFWEKGHAVLFLNSHVGLHVGAVTIQWAKKRCWTIKKNQNWINIYILPFKAMAIMANYCFFIHMNVNMVKTHYGDPLWGITLYYFPWMCMFECIPLQTFQIFSQYFCILCYNII
jgi:hypothetical protein